MRELKNITIANVNSFILNEKKYIRLFDKIKKFNLQKLSLK